MKKQVYVTDIMTLIAYDMKMINDIVVNGYKTKTNFASLPLFQRLINSAKIKKEILDRHNIDVAPYEYLDLFPVYDITPLEV
jgi:hypothetical protein